MSVNIMATLQFHLSLLSLKGLSSELNTPKSELKTRVKTRNKTKCDMVTLEEHFYRQSRKQIPQKFQNMSCCHQWDIAISTENLGLPPL